MKSVNKAILLGRVGKDPEIRATPSVTTVATFTLATSERQKDQSGNYQEKTEWHNCIAFQRTAEIIRDYIKKGAMLFIEGKLQTRSWDADGQKKYRTEIVVNELVMMGAAPEKEAAKPSRGNYANPEITDDDIPF